VSIFSDLQSAAARDAIRLHTPGHKGSLHELDMTELVDGSFPSDSIERAQANAAALYGARHCTFLACGSSQGVKAAVYYAAKNGIVGANSHRSVFDGFTLSGKKCVSVGGRTDIMPITAADIERALTPDIGVAVVTSPTYYGFCADLAAIRKLCDERGLLLIADGAHGAHFGSSPLLPESPSRYADICNLSAHKTLDALTQGAFMLDNLNDEDGKRLRAAAELMGTTSPSYLLYSSVERGVTELFASDGKYAALYECVSALRREFPFLKNDDFTRLVLDCAAVGIPSKRLCDELCRRGVFAELADERYIVFIVTAADSPLSLEKFGRVLGSSISKLGVK